MPGLGTVVSVIAIVIGGLLGIVLRHALSESLQKGLIAAMGLSTLFIGLAGALSKMLVVEAGGINVTGTMLLLGSLTLGTLIGEWLRLEERLQSFGLWLQEKTRNGSENTFVRAFVISSLTVCIGAMAVVGSIEDGLFAQRSTLFAKSALDFIIVMVFAASMGKGAIFAAVPVGIFQGSITVLAVLLSPFITKTALYNISLTGSVLIFCVGVNLLWEGKFKVANMLPALVVAVIAAHFF
jgi:uncharacterized membrane protein YqgA involved in biofilm formation